MKRPPAFRRFLLIMRFLLEGLSLAVVIGVLFAMLERSMKQKQIGRINAQQAELRLHFTNRLNYTHSRVEGMMLRSDLPVLLCTGYSANITESMASNIGARVLIYKPLVRDELSAAIRNILDNPSTA